MKEQLLSILNENSAELTVEKAMKIAALLCEREFGRGEPELKLIRELHFYYHVTQSFESFKKIRLEKGQFVCEVEKPATYDLKVGVHAETRAEQMQCEAYELALQKVIFEGFEKDNSIPKYHQEADRVVMVGGSIRLHLFTNINEVQLYIYGFRLDIAKCTIGDLLTEIERYNRTAKEPIKLKFTENILPILGVKI